MSFLNSGNKGGGMVQQRQMSTSLNQRRAFSAAAPSSNRCPTNPHVFFEISMDGKDLGRMEFELYMNKVPKTAENFRSLCAGDGEKGYTYAKSIFHRVIDGFMAQGGDFTNHNGTGGKSIYGDRFADEATGLELQHTKRGMLSMANAGPDTNGSQFFIIFNETAWLNGKHAVFGEMTVGEDVLKQIEKHGSGSG